MVQRGNGRNDVILGSRGMLHIQLWNVASYFSHWGIWQVLTTGFIPTTETRSMVQRGTGRNDLKLLSQRCVNIPLEYILQPSQYFFWYYSVQSMRLVLDASQLVSCQSGNERPCVFLLACFSHEKSIYAVWSLICRFPIDHFFFSPISHAATVQLSWTSSWGRQGCTQILWAIRYSTCAR